MIAKRFLSALAATLFAAAAFGQAAIWIELPAGSIATDVTVAGNQVVVVGLMNNQPFRWTQAGGLQTLGAQYDGGSIRVSADGSRVVTTIFQGNDVAAYWENNVWHPIVGLGGTSGTSETLGQDISGDGQTIVGLGWIPSGQGHCLSWNTATGPHDLGGAFSDPSSRANAVNGDGSVIVGMKDLLDGTREGARWTNGVLAHITYVDPSQVTHALGEAYGVNTSGTTIVGYRVYNGPNSAWRWDASTGVSTLLQNLAGQTTAAVANGLSDDASIIVGHSGGNSLSGTTGIVWINNQPLDARTWLANQGTPTVGGYVSIGFVNAVSRDGSVLVGSPAGQSQPQPPGGWIAILPGAQVTGTTFCSGDGSATACPCGNVGGAGRGCASSVEPTGAKLTATGSSSITMDTLTLRGIGMPNSSALYFQGTTQAGVGLGTVFGDGLRCAGGSVVRLKTVVNSAGASQFPAAGDPSLSIKGNITAPGTRTYQVWYRNAAAFCTISTFNLTNGVSVDWGA